MSPAGTASGSIFRLNNCLRPSILTLTVPPPEDASTTVSCIFFCRVSYCCLACDISCWRLKPPMNTSKISRLQFAAPTGLGSIDSTFSPTALLIPAGLLFIALIDNRSDLRAEFFLHPPDDRVLFGTGAPATIRRGSGPRWRGLGGSARENFQFHRSAHGAARRGNR